MSLGVPERGRHRGTISRLKRIPISLLIAFVSAPVRPGEYWFGLKQRRRVDAQGQPAQGDVRATSGTES
jgi:hypothetical protein